MGLRLNNLILRTSSYFNKYSNIKRYTHNNLYEPDYLELLKPKVPIYDEIDIQIKGYDYRVLENYQSLINTIADNMNLSVEECWATPCRQYQIQKFKDKTNIIESEYQLNMYERNVQVVDVPAPIYPTFLRLLEASMPEGVTLQAREHLEEHDNVRYVPDQELKQLKSQLEELGGARVKK